MLLANAGLLAAVLLAPQGIPPGTPIVEVRVIRRDVFDLNDPATSSWPFRTANRLHVLTSEGFIRSLLLFRPGDVLDPALLEESERLLRATGFLNPVTIRAEALGEGAVVTVETSDQWTTEVDLNLGILGNRSKSGLSIQEGNFFGWGKEVLLDYRSDQERDSLTVGYEDPLFLGTRWRLAGAHVEASDGTADSFGLVYPFFALATETAGGIEWERDDLRQHLYTEGNKRVSGDTSRTEARVWGGLRVPRGEKAVDRLVVGLFVDRKSFSNWAYRDGSPFEQPEARDLSGLEVGWERQVDRWEVLRGFRAWQAQEDVALGPNWKVLLGFSAPQLSGQHAIRVRSEYAAGRLAGAHYDWFRAAFTGRVQDGNVTNGVASLRLGRARYGDRGWRARLAVDLGTRLDRDQQLTLGADTGLRGWDPDTFDGTSRAVANLEWRRRLTGEIFHLGILGFAVFADAGSTWGARVGRSTGGVRGDVGMGLQLEVTRAATLHVVRLEVAFPDDRSGPLMLVTAGSLF